MIVVTTPTGKIGRQVTERLIAADQHVRLIARDPARLSATVRRRAHVVQGTHRDVDRVRVALRGAESLFLVLPPDPHAASVERHYLDFAQSAALAIDAEEVSRVVYISTLGTHIKEGGGHMSAALAADELIKNTGAHLRVLRMPFFMENLLNQIEPVRTRGAFFLPNLADRPLPTVTVGDVAAVAADLLVNDAWRRQADIPVVGPDSLSPNDMAQMMSEVIERPIRYQQLTSEAYTTMLTQRGMSATWAQGLADMAAKQNDGAYDGVRHQPSTATTTFQKWCEEVLRPAVAR